MVENLVTGDPLTQDLTESLLLGGTAGLAGAGLVGSVGGLTSASLGVRVVHHVALQADLLGLTSAGLFDPVLAPLMTDTELDDVKGDAQTLGYVAGTMAIAGTFGVGVGNRITSGRPAQALNEASDRFDDAITGAVQRLGGAGFDAALAQQGDNVALQSRPAEPS